MIDNLTAPMKDTMQKLGTIINYLNYAESCINQFISLEYLGKIDPVFIVDVLDDEAAAFYLKQRIFSKILDKRGLKKSFPQGKLDRLRKLRHMAAHSVIVGEPVRDGQGAIVDMSHVKLRKGATYKSIEDLVRDYDEIVPEVDAGLEEVFKSYNVGRESFLPPTL